MNSRLIILLIAITSVVYSVETDNLDHEEITSLIKYFTANPLNINEATVSDIYELPYISEIDAENIFYRIESKGVIENLKTLIDEKIISSETVKILKPCIKFKAARSEIRKGEYSLRSRRTLERSRAYEDSIYLGNANMISQKLSFYDRRISYNFLIEKEPGEIYYTDNFKANLIIRNNDEYRIILGNFNLTSISGMLQKEGFTMDPYSYRSSAKFHDFTKSAPTSNDYSGYNGVSAFYTFSKHRLSVFWGLKNLSASLNDSGEITSAGLTSYSRTVTEIEKRFNSMHETAGAGYEGEMFGIKYGMSVSDERFDRDLSEGSSFRECTLGELSLSRTSGAWSFRTDAATDFDDVNFKTNALFRSKNLNTDFYYGYIQKNRFSFTSTSMMFGTTGDEEQVFGMKFLIKLSNDMIFISDNLIYSTEYFGSGFPGSQFTLKSNIKSGRMLLEPSFIYKSRETTTENFVTSEAKEYNAKIKSAFDLKPFLIGFDASYTEKDTGYGYILGTGIDYRAENWKVRAGGDIYYTVNGTLIYTSGADIGRYPSMASYSGQGRKSYIMIAYNPEKYEISAGISRLTKEDKDYSGSGYDEIDSGTVHEAELNFRYLF
jgi:hypothetical protein